MTDRVSIKDADRQVAVGVLQEINKQLQQTVENIIKMVKMSAKEMAAADMGAVVSFGALGVTSFTWVSGTESGVAMAIGSIIEQAKKEGVTKEQLMAALEKQYDREVKEC